MKIGTIKRFYFEFLHIFFLMFKRSSQGKYFLYVISDIRFGLINVSRQIYLSCLLPFQVNWRRFCVRQVSNYSSLIRHANDKGWILRVSFNGCIIDKLSYPVILSVCIVTRLVCLPFRLPFAKSVSIHQPAVLCAPTMGCNQKIV